MNNRVVHSQGFAFLVSNNEENRSASDTQIAGDCEEGGAFHFGSKNSKAFPGFPVVPEGCAYRDDIGIVLTVERVLALHDSQMMTTTLSVRIVPLSAGWIGLIWLSNSSAGK